MGVGILHVISDRPFKVDGFHALLVSFHDIRP